MKYLKTFENEDDKKGWGKNSHLPKYYHSLTPEQKQKHKEVGEAIRKMMNTPRTMAFIHPKEAKYAVNRLKYILEDEGFKVKHTTQPTIQNGLAFRIFHRDGTKQSICDLQNNLDFIEFKDRLVEDLGYCRVSMQDHSYADMTGNPDLDVSVSHVITGDDMFSTNPIWFFRLLIINLPNRS